MKDEPEGFSDSSLILNPYFWGDMFVAKITIVLSILLIVLGIAGYYATDQVSWTALIPAFFGGLISILGIVALSDRFRKHAMHVAVMVGLLGFFGAGYPLVKSLLKEPAALSQAAMTILCGVFVCLCIRSFIAARRSRQKDAQA